jgi:predicted pyridoxine 5'-phosphate oxidase superfamily flavin-nucleotide-binding protein
MEGRMKRPGASGEQQAQARFGTAKRAAAFCANQQLDHLNEAMRQFIARQEMMSIATSDAAGRCDCSFRAGEPGFVQVLSSKTLAYPEYRGNGVLGERRQHPRESPHRHDLPGLLRHPQSWGRVLQSRIGPF